MTLKINHHSSFSLPLLYNRTDSFLLDIISTQMNVKILRNKKKLLGFEYI